VTANDREQEEMSVVRSMVTNLQSIGANLMGVWDFMGLHQTIKKWEKLANTAGISDADRSFYLRKVDEAKFAYERFAKSWEYEANQGEEVADEPIS